MIHKLMIKYMFRRYSLMIVPEWALV